MSNYRSNNMHRSQGEYHSPMHHMTEPCYGQENHMEGMTIAMAYVPRQSWRDIYDPAKGLSRGTIFKELDKPFLGKGAMKR